jgi:transcriptional regulator GlxA family with amidase domain
MLRHEQLAALLRHLVADPGSTRGIDHLANALSVSRRTFTRLFRAQTGLSFNVWRSRLRLLTAGALMAQGESLAKAAARVGYASLPAFRAMVQRELGADAPYFYDVLSDASLGRHVQTCI